MKTMKGLIFMIRFLLGSSLLD